MVTILFESFYILPNEKSDLVFSVYINLLSAIICDNKYIGLWSISFFLYLCSGQFVKISLDKPHCSCTIFSSSVHDLLLIFNIVFVNFVWFK